MYACMHACMYVHVQVCHFGSVLTICVPGVRIYVMYMRMLYICVCVCEVILFSCDVRLGGSNVNVSIYLSIHPSIYFSIYLSVCLSIHLFIYSSI